KFGNTFAYFRFDTPKGAQVIRHAFTAKVWQLDWGLDPGKVEHVERWPGSFDPYLKGDRTVVIEPRLRDLLKDIAPKAAEGEGLLSVMGWVNRQMKYGPLDAELRGSSTHALDKRFGDCSAYHGLCAAFGRALGVPTRVTYGLHLFPKESPSHCKLEAFLLPYGWVSFDVSETQKLLHQIEK